MVNDTIMLSVLKVTFGPRVGWGVEGDITVVTFRVARVSICLDSINFIFTVEQGNLHLKVQQSFTLSCSCRLLGILHVQYFHSTAGIYIILN